MTLPNGKPKAEARQREWEAFQKKKKKKVRGERLCCCPRREWSCQNARWELEILLLPTLWCRHHTRAARPTSQTHTIPTPTTRHPHGHTHHATPTSASAFTLKYLIYPLKSQNLCFLCLAFLFMRNPCLCYYYFFLALWLSYWWVCACLCDLWLCATMQLYYIDKSESRVSRY